MSGFTDKLRRRFKVERAPGELSEATAEFLRRRLLRRLPAAPPAVELPAGEVAANAAGEFFLRALRYPLAMTHGGSDLAAAGAIDRQRLAELARDEALADLDLERCLFLDTETTGLAGGVGTVVFLCGLAWIDGGELWLEQVFLRAFADEPGALAHVARRLAERPCLVTFVGKSFDRHRLAARMALHRIDAAILRARHIDLYHLARRAWRDRLPDVRLRTVEEAILGVRRPDDLPGAFAPAAWLDWLRDRTGPVDRVFEHNRLDLLSLVTLLATLAK